MLSTFYTIWVLTLCHLTDLPTYVPACLRMYLNPEIMYIYNSKLYISYIYLTLMDVILEFIIYKKAMKINIYKLVTYLLNFVCMLFNCGQFFIKSTPGRGGSARSCRSTRAPPHWLTTRGRFDGSELAVLFYIGEIIILIWGLRFGTNKYLIFRSFL
jgi:hypothetical protein